MDKRYGRVHWGKGQERSRTSPENWRLPLQWDKTQSVICDQPDCDFFVKKAGNPGAMCPEAGCTGTLRRKRVFCASLADWLDEEVPAGWLADLIYLIGKTPHLDWQLLTKRPELWRSRMEAVRVLSAATNFEAGAIAANWLSGSPPHNVWIGTSVEDQDNYDRRLSPLLQIPARVRFLSAEPLLGPMRVSAAKGVDWIILGGESGAGARECRIEWIEDLIIQCRRCGVAPFVKQLGALPTYEHDAGKGGCRMPLNIKDKKGGNIDEFPAVLRVREFPK